MGAAFHSGSASEGRAIRDLPELVRAGAASSLIRIPPELDVPVTPRVRRLIDAAPFRRLSRISQLGLVGLVYPAANHSRFEHSLGVYRLALLYLSQMSFDERFAAAVGPRDAELFLAAALLHDLGHWPFCHPIEDMHLPGLPRHEQFAAAFLQQEELAELLQRDWKIDPEELVALLSLPAVDARGKILRSLLSGPIDVDKMDYLLRDSLHAGVPYGRHFDQQRLIGSLCLNETGDGLAITDKGRTAAEMMVFARYVMFSEVYWHHAVRSATAMLQRAFFLLRPRLDLERLFSQVEQEFIAELLPAAEQTAAAELVGGLFGPRRRLYKRLAQFSFIEQRDMYERIAGRPFPWLVRLAGEFAAEASRRGGGPIAAEEILFDAPPVEREVEFNVQVYFPKRNEYRWLEEISPVTRTLAREQFDDYVKRVRLFVHPRLAATLSARGDLDELLLAAIDRCGDAAPVGQP